ncbi:MAG: polyprenyl synthetase family protein [Prevotellaceae bacterium]|nr:polyprenyl synthetase family protein [Prevotellaceae bacterium]
MTNLDRIKYPVRDEFAKFEAGFKSAFQTENALLAQIASHILQKNGKKLRPAIVLLAAKLCANVCNAATVESAVALELLHTASLIHDDIVDDTMIRRGMPSVNAVWNNKISVLAGDYFLSNALHFTSRTQNLKIMTLLAEIGICLSEGELSQLSKGNQISISEAEYLAIIRSKTALLFASCAKMGALSVDADEHKTLKMSLFGEFLGICFQIKDDIFDYSENKNIGKPTGNDIREGKITLPLIFALQNAAETEKSEIVNILKTNDLNNTNIEKIIKFVKDNGGIEYSIDKMLIYKDKAIAELDSFPDGELKNALAGCAEFAVQRNF